MAETVATQDASTAISHAAREGLQKLATLRDDFVRRATQDRYRSAESLEWAKLQDNHRMLLLLLAGIDGDLATLAQRNWLHIPPAEREAIKLEVRALKRGLTHVSALTSRTQA